MKKSSYNIFKEALGNPPKISEDYKKVFALVQELRDAVDEHINQSSVQVKILIGIWGGGKNYFELQLVRDGMKDSLINIVVPVDGFPAEIHWTNENIPSVKCENLVHLKDSLIKAIQSEPARMLFCIYANTGSLI